jgi:hypothetical protein
MTSIAEKPGRVDVAQPARTRSWLRSLTMPVVVFAVALTALGACSPADSTAVPDTVIPETAVTAEIDQLLGDYEAAWNTYDVDALRPMLTDGFMVYETNPDAKHGISTGASESQDLADTLIRLEGGWQLGKGQIQRLGEPIMTGDGPWVVSQAWRLTMESYDLPVTECITTYTIVDEDGTLKIARAIAVCFEVEELGPGFLHPFDRARGSDRSTNLRGACGLVLLGTAVCPRVRRLLGGPGLHPRLPEMLPN